MSIHSYVVHYELYKHFWPMPPLGNGLPSGEVILPWQIYVGSTARSASKPTWGREVLMVSGRDDAKEADFVFAAMIPRDHKYKGGTTREGIPLTRIERLPDGLRGIIMDSPQLKKRGVFLFCF